jgi:plastocyanin
MNCFNLPDRVILLFAVALFTFGCGIDQSKDRDVGSSEAQPGRIRGIVRLQGNAPSPDVEAITQDQKICGTSVSLPRLAVGRNNGVQYTFVYLDGVQGGAPASRPPKTVLVDQKDCQYVPHALTVPVGTKIEITNSDPILHNVHGHKASEEGAQTIFNIAQPVQGQRTLVEPTLTKPGIVVLSCEAGHPWMSAHIFVAEHPYVAVTDDDGEFVISDVPVGTYRIKMWHEGVKLTRNDKALQHYEYEDPYEMTQEVAVQPGSEAVVNFDLALRPTT